MPITILGENGGEDGAAQQTVAGGLDGSADIDPAGLEYSGFTSTLMIFQDAGPDDDDALDVSELVTADAADAVAELMQADSTAHDVFVDVGVPADLGVAAGFDPILTITEVSQAEIDVAAIF